MDIARLYECLSMDEKKQLLYLLKKEKVEDSKQMFVRDWVDKIEPSVRLRNLLMAKWRRENKLVSEVTAEEFFTIRNAGQKSWCEFEELRGY